MGSVPESAAVGQDSAVVAVVTIVTSLTLSLMLADLMTHGALSSRAHTVITRALSAHRARQAAKRAVADTLFEARLIVEGIE
jgi:hypothetical protein